MAYLKIRSESGMVILITLFITLISSIAIASFLSSVIYESRHSVWQMQRVQALFVAESGIENARTELRKSEDFSVLLKGLDEVGGTTDDGIITGPSVAGGVYEVIIVDNDDGDGDPFTDSDLIVIATSVGTWKKETRTVRTHLGKTSGATLDAAIIVDGDLMISGVPNIEGACGSVHANGDMLISGDAIIAEDATSSGNFEISGSPEIGGDQGYQDPIDVPEINPVDYRGLADYILFSNGMVFDSFGVMQSVSNDTFNGWKWGGTKWDYSNDAIIANGNTYYIMGDALVSGNVGTAGNPWYISIIAEGSIEISGELNMKTTNSRNILFVAGRDLKVNGNPSQSIEGLMLVHEQFAISGEPVLHGAIVVENAESSGDGMLDENLLNGNMTITYNCNYSLDNSGIASVVIIGWQEVLGN